MKTSNQALGLFLYNLHEITFNFIHGALSIIFAQVIGHVRYVYSNYPYLTWWFHTYFMRMVMECIIYVFVLEVICQSSENMLLFHEFETVGSKENIAICSYYIQNCMNKDCYFIWFNISLILFAWRLAKRFLDFMAELNYLLKIRLHAGFCK